MAALPGANETFEIEQPFRATREQVAGAPWQHDWRDIYLVDSDRIANHYETCYLGILDGTEDVTDWNPWEGVTGPHPMTVERMGYGGPAAALQVRKLPAQLAIDSSNRNPDHAQAQLSGVSSIAALVPFLTLPDVGQGQDVDSMAEFTGGGHLPFHFDFGAQLDMGSAISPRHVLRPPPSINDQTAAVYAAGF